jgi:TPR repeat protein
VAGRIPVVGGTAGRAEPGPLAEQGNAAAQFNLAIIYAKGRGVPQHYATAVSWLRKSADQGDADAQNNLGFMYEMGRGVPQDFAAALSWFRKAADKGHTEAQRNLGIMYFAGRGIPQDSHCAHVAQLGCGQRERCSCGRPGYCVSEDDTSASRGSAEAGPRVEAEMTR